MLIRLTMQHILLNLSSHGMATDPEKFQKICEQKWAAIFGEGVQAYTEVRRTGFPARVFEYELAGAYYPGFGLPIRVQYALTEETLNTDNLRTCKDSSEH